MRKDRKMELPVFSLEPSVICCDLCALGEEIRTWEQAGVTALHIDVLDGAFAPSLPVGIDTFLQLSERTELPFDVHIMSRNNAWFIDQCIRMNAARICFQVEGEPDPAGMLARIRKAGISPGLAFSPDTPMESVCGLLDEADFILLMRINPGYAGFAGESVRTDLDDKIRHARKLLDAGRTGRDIVIDGRVTFEDIPRLKALGATVMVGGSRSLFSGKDYNGNFRKAKALYLGE